MTLEKELIERSNNACELCGSKEKLTVFEFPETQNMALYACANCTEQMQDADKIDPNHWRCLNDSMWSEHAAVKVMAWRMLNRIKVDWTQDLLNMMYIEEDILELAKAAGDGVSEENKIVHRDVNGVVLEAGDSVVLIKDLKVKGTSMVAKQGTAVRNIRLDHDNETYIEGKVSGQNIVIVTEYVKKT